MSGPPCRAHKLPTIQRQVKKQGPNTGRWFWCCSVPVDGCGFSAWVEAGAPTPLAGAPAGGEHGASHGSPGPPRQPHSGGWGAASAPPWGSPGPQGSQGTCDTPPQSQGHARGPGGSSSGRLVVRLQLSGHDSFAATSAYNTDLIAFYKAQPERRYDPNDRAWVFPLDHYVQFLTDLCESGLPVQVQEIPPHILAGDSPAPPSRGRASMGAELPPVLSPQQARRPPEEAEARMQRHLPPELLSRLYQYQREGVVFALRHGARVLIADEMGLGKTVQAVVAAACHPEDWPLLVVAPSSLKLVWLDALHNWLPAPMTDPLSPQRVHIEVVSSAKEVDKKLTREFNSHKTRIVVTSYELVQKLPHPDQYGFWIIDESHHLKSPNALRTRFIAPLVKRAKRALLMTGTPALSRPIELYPQVDMLRPGLLGSEHEFGMRYCGGKPSLWGPGMDFSGSSNLRELNTILEDGVMIRRLKAQVLHELPEKQRMRVPISTDPTFHKELAAARQQLAALESDGAMGEEERRQQQREWTSKFYTASGQAKAQEVAAHCQRLLQAGEKLLLFAHHTSVLDALETALRPIAAAAAAATSAAGVGSGQARDQGCYVRIDGGVSERRRKAAVDAFQNEPRTRLALLSITAAGVGLTMTAARIVVFAELFWNPGQMVQAEDRAHRLGTTGHVEVHYLLAPGTIDDIMWPLVNRKLRVVGKLLEGGGAGAAEGLSAAPAPSRALVAAAVERTAAEEAEAGAYSLAGDDSAAPAGVAGGDTCWWQQPRGGGDAAATPAGEEAQPSGARPAAEGGGGSRAGGAAALQALECVDLTAERAGGERRSSVQRHLGGGGVGRAAWQASQESATTVASSGADLRARKRKLDGTSKDDAIEL